MTRIFIHCVGSLRSLQTLDAAIPGFDRYPERALLLAEPGDLVCVGAPVDTEYLEFLAGIGLGPRPEDVIVVEGTGPLAERLRAAPHPLVQRLRGIGGTGVWVEPYAGSDAAFALAAALRCELGALIRVRTGLPEITAHADQKHLMRERAQSLGIPVAEGEVAMLAHAGGRRRRRPGHGARRDRAPARRHRPGHRPWQLGRVGVVHLHRGPRRRRYRRRAPADRAPDRQPLVPGRGDGGGHRLAQPDARHPRGRRPDRPGRGERPALGPGPGPRRQSEPQLRPTRGPDGGVGAHAGVLAPARGLRGAGGLRLRRVP